MGGPGGGGHYPGGMGGPGGAMGGGPLASGGARGSGGGGGSAAAGAAAAAGGSSEAAAMRTQYNIMPAEDLVLDAREWDKQLLDPQCGQLQLLGALMRVAAWDSAVQMLQWLQVCVCGAGFLGV